MIYTKWLDYENKYTYWKKTKQLIVKCNEWYLLLKAIIINSIYLISFIVNNYKYLWTRGTEMRMNIKMDTEDQEDERNTDIPEEVTELDNSMEHIMDENTRISIISKILNTLLIIKVFTQWCTETQTHMSLGPGITLKVINISEVWYFSYHSHI